MLKKSNLNTFILGATIGAVSALAGATAYTIRSINRMKQVNELNNVKNSEFAKRIKLDAEKDEKLRQVIARLDQPVVTIVPKVMDSNHE